MKWSFKIGSFRGIGVYVHATFFLLIAFVVLSYWGRGEGLAKTLEGVAFVLVLFGCIVAHEFGHALTAARYGIKTRDITLLPIGGLARLERMPDEPLQELWVALAGPAVNVVIAVALFAWLQLTSALEPISQLTLTGGPFLERLMLVNVILVLFNMLPAFPMDGGRVLRAILATRMDYAQATQIAASTGQAMALMFGLLGFFINPFLLFIALFVWIGAAQEASMAQMKSSLSQIPVLRATITNFTSLAPGDPLSKAVDAILAGSQQEFPVLDEGRVVGILTRQNLVAGLAEHGPQSHVGQSMQHDCQTIDAAEMLETAFRQLQEAKCHTIPVVHDGQLVGLVTLDNIGELLAIEAALGTTSSNGQAAAALRTYR